MTELPLRKNRDFVLLQVGQTLSTIGSESTGIAYPLLVLAITHSPVQAGVVGLTAGTSTPERVIDEVRTWLEAL